MAVQDLDGGYLKVLPYKHPQVQMLFNLIYLLNIPIQSTLANL